MARFRSVSVITRRPTETAMRSMISPCAAASSSAPQIARAGIPVFKIRFSKCLADRKEVLKMADALLHALSRVQAGIDPRVEQVLRRPLEAEELRGIDA